MADEKNQDGKRPRTDNFSNKEKIEFEEVAPLEVPEEIKKAATTAHDDFDWSQSAKHQLPYSDEDIAKYLKDKGFYKYWKKRNEME